MHAVCAAARSLFRLRSSVPAQPAAMPPLVLRRSAMPPGFSVGASARREIRALRPQLWMFRRRYAKSGDVYVAYHVFGDGPFNLVATPGWVSNVELIWDDPDRAVFYRGLAPFARVAVFDNEVRARPTASLVRITVDSTRRSGVRRPAARTPDLHRPLALHLVTPEPPVLHLDPAATRDVTRSRQRPPVASEPWLRASGRRSRRANVQLRAK